MPRVQKLANHPDGEASQVVRNPPAHAGDAGDLGSILLEENNLE